MNKIFSKKILSVLSILTVLVLADQWTKHLAVKHLKNSAPINHLDGMFQLLYAENPGAFLGMGGDMSPATRFVVFGLFVAIGLAVMFWSIMKNKVSQTETIAYSFILAGGIGNVIDRLTHLNGHVIDFMFIDLKFAPLARTGVFNVADMAIVVGVLMLLFQSRKVSQKD
ncbi:MAG: signal peptidase II [Moraxellaceae bacterium]|nr:signal peptidase II [Pseudobdellovibrionaceae bacterium]